MWYIGPLLHLLFIYRKFIPILQLYPTATPWDCKQVTSLAPFAFPLLSETLLRRLVSGRFAVPVYSVWTDFDSVRFLPKGLKKPLTKQILFQTFIRTSKGQQRCGEEFQRSARLHYVGNLCGSAHTASSWP